MGLHLLTASKLSRKKNEDVCFTFCFYVFLCQGPNIQRNRRGTNRGLQLRSASQKHPPADKRRGFMHRFHNSRKLGGDRRPLRVTTRSQDISRRRRHLESRPGPTKVTEQARVCSVQGVQPSRLRRSRSRQGKADTRLFRHRPAPL